MTVQRHHGSHHDSHHGPITPDAARGVPSLTGPGTSDATGLRLLASLQPAARSGTPSPARHRTITAWTWGVAVPLVAAALGVIAWQWHAARQTLVAPPAAVSQEHLALAQPLPPPAEAPAQAPAQTPAQTPVNAASVARIETAPADLARTPAAAGNLTAGAAAVGIAAAANIAKAPQATAPLATARPRKPTAKAGTPRPRGAEPPPVAAVRKDPDVELIAALIGRMDAAEPTRRSQEGVATPPARRQR